VQRVEKRKHNLKMHSKEKYQEKVQEQEEDRFPEDQQDHKKKKHNQKPQYREIKSATNHPSDFLPSYLRPFVQHSYEDFFISPSFDPRLVAQLMCEGFLPISNRRHLIPKLHKKRCVIYPLKRKIECKHSESSTSDISTYESCVHSSKSTTKKAKRFLFTVNQDFEAVVKGCHVQHGVSWLHPPIVEAFRVMHERTRNEPGTGITANLVGTNQDDDGGDGNSTSHKLECVGLCPVRLYSVEVWNAATGNLAAGELGYSCGSIYTSLTGFTAEDSAGSVQLVALGRYLSKGSFDMWDLGMELDYKMRLGADNMDRILFVSTIKKLRVEDQNAELKCDERMCCKDIIVSMS